MFVRDFVQVDRGVGAVRQRLLDPWFLQATACRAYRTAAVAVAPYPVPHALGSVDHGVGVTIGDERWYDDSWLLGLAWTGPGFPGPFTSFEGDLQAIGLDDHHTHLILSGSYTTGLSDEIERRAQIRLHCGAEAAVRALLAGLSGAELITH
jgi:hypothetical protein